jgi:hypothetical protein
MNTLARSLFVVVLAAAGWYVYAGESAKGDKKGEPRVFELRTYYAAPGKMKALHERFRTHTNKCFPS